MAFDAFLRLANANGDIVIQGDSTDKTHSGEIEIDSFSWGVSNTGSAGSGSGGGAGKAVVQDFSFAAGTSKASPNLMLACATGKHIPSAILTCRRVVGTAVEFLKIRLSDVLVSSYSLGGTSEGTAEAPEDDFSLAFVKIDFLYTNPRTGETVESVFDSGLLG